MDSTDESFSPINQAYARVFRPRRLSLGLVVPLEHYEDGPVPSMERHVERAQLAEELGFGAIWLRDVPFNVPSFGDAGQTYDPFVYLGFLAAKTNQIALATGSIILPLRHPAHVAKAAATTDQLSGGRLLLGVASGDRPDEYPALDVPFENRNERFRDSFKYIRKMADDYPDFDTRQGRSDGQMDMLPKPTADRLPLLITGGSRQSPEWVAEHGDGWITYPREVAAQAGVVAAYRAKTRDAGESEKPVSQSLYIDLVEDGEPHPRPIHLGFRSGVEYLRFHLKSLEKIGINHVCINLRFNQADIEDTLRLVAREILPHFPLSHQS